MAEKTRREFLTHSTLGTAAMHRLSRSSMRSQASASPRGLVASWRFDGSALDTVTGREDDLSGHFEYVDGLDGQALKFDGFTTRLTRLASNAPAIGEAFTIEAWIALAAYPWNWCTLVGQRDGALAGFDFQIGPEGELRLGMSMDDVFFRAEWRECRSEPAVQLRVWSHVAAVYDASGLRLYANGVEVSRLELKGRLAPATEAELRLGMNSEQVPASHPHRSYSNLPTWFALDGLVDEVAMHDTALTADEIRAHFDSRQPTAAPVLAERGLPAVPKEPARFGATYGRLAYHKEWDDLWPVGEYPDVVVRFDDSPVRVVFWRGTSYSPAWITEREVWLTDQSVEGWNDSGTFEHMNDPRCKHSHVRIVESHDARVVVHWRYAPVNTAGEFWRPDPVTGWGCWVDEIHTFYPDGVACRNITWKRGSLASPRQFQETLPLCGPGQRAEDVIELDALTLGNLRGESATYRWPGDAASRRNQRPDDATIEIVHLKSDAQPFYVFPTGTRIQVLGGTPRRGIYSAFPHVNHWPVAMIPSDGRTCLVPDRASSFSPCIATPPVTEDDDSERSSTSWLWGTCDGKVGSVVELARYRSRPAPVDGAQFDPGEHVYRITTAGTELRINASPDTPAVRPAFIATGWKSGAPRVVVDGRELRRDVDYRAGVRRTLEGDDLVLWLDAVLDRPTTLRLD